MCHHQKVKIQTVSCVTVKFAPVTVSTSVVKCESKLSAINSVSLTFVSVVQNGSVWKN